MAKKQHIPASLRKAEQNIFVPSGLARGFLKSFLELQKKPSFWVKHFNFLFKSDIDSFEGTECDKIRERIKKFNPNMFCLNADIKMGISNRKKSKQFLEELFSTPSPFEK